MISKHLQGKNAEQIANGVRKRWEHRLNAYDDEGYIKELEMLLLLAVKDALISTHEEKGTYVGYVQSVEMRATTFLNMVLPKE
jgi:hypothetical protein